MRRRGKKFTEPVALSSPDPAGSPLPRTTLGLGFDLPALRARCNPHSRPLRQRVQARRLQKARSLRKNHMRCLRWRFVAHALQGSGARRRGFEASAAGRGRARPPERESRSLRRTCRARPAPAEGGERRLGSSASTRHNTDSRAFERRRRLAMGFAQWRNVRLRLAARPARRAQRRDRHGSGAGTRRSSPATRAAAAAARARCRRFGATYVGSRMAQLVKLDRAREPARPRQALNHRCSGE